MSLVIYNPWTWKQSEDSLKLSLTPKRSEFTGVQKLFLLWREIGDKIDHYISYRVFFPCEATEGAGDWLKCKYEHFKLRNVPLPQLLQKFASSLSRK